MPDLILKLFDGELSEGDWQALEAQVAASPDEALRLSEEAERRYAAFGLPEPRLARGRGKGLWFGAAGALALATIMALPARKVTRPELGLAGESYVIQAPAAEGPKPARPAAAEKFTEQGDLLSVSIALQRSEMATVEVVDASGRRVRRIYSGLLKGGDWSFSWDGKLDNGAKPPAGSYTIVLKAGGATQRRSLRIE